MNDKTVILLTACISPGGMAYTALQDSNERKRQYIDAIKFYIDSTNYPIVFCNNSGEDLSVEIPKVKNRVEFLSFFGNDYDKQLGKGHGEYKIIEYALHNSKHLQDASTIIKITGRLKIFDLETQIRVASICYFFDSSYILVADFSQKWISKFTDKAFLDSIITSDYILNNQYVVPEVKYYSTYASTKSYTTA